MNAIRVIIRFAPLCAMLLIAAEIVMTTQLAGSGQEMRALDTAIEKLRYESELLTQQVASASSLLTVGAKAKELGFVEATPKQLFTLGPETLPVALRYPQ